MSKKITNEEFINRAKELYGNFYNYDKTFYKNYHEKITVSCPIHGDFLTIPADFLKGHECKKCGYKKNAANRADTVDKFIEKAKKVHKEKYDYSLVEYENSKKKIKIICPEHGIFEQIPNSHLAGKGCPKCGLIKNTNKRKKSKEQYALDAKKIHGEKYDYSLVKYKNNKEKVEIICPKHGIFSQNALQHLKGAGCPACYIKSRGEELIAKILEDNNYVLNETYFREYKFEDCRDTYPLPFDFYIPSKKLLIEFNGKQHYKKSIGFKDTDKTFLKRKHHDWLKRKYARDNNMDLLIIPYWKYGDMFQLLKNYES